MVTPPAAVRVVVEVVVCMIYDIRAEAKLEGGKNGRHGEQAESNICR